ncbi:LPS kinase [Paractinoplanes deccanensis]|uniref:LPS kinase n=1 Tax=Paractinoplanes deccanensis TaxID=113561 RepID=A0ABQ3YDD2_9ACTN|nr:LPS kinase [Actinoplanes deccanensis]
MRITSAVVDPALLELPWHIPLEEWPADHLVALPQGISRHVVRFVKLNDVVYALKETRERIAEKEYDLLRALERIDFPAVEAVAIVTDREDPHGEPLETVLITRHLQFSLPYRALFSHVLRPNTLNRLLDALAALVVRMHLTGFSWGDCSLSNTLFRRDAGAFAAYLVDAETGNLYPKLSEGQRSEDIEILRLNIFGELLDLQAAELLHESIDPEAVVDDIVARYERLWHEVTYEQKVPRDDARHDIEGRIRRLNELGFDVAEVAMSTTDGGYRVRPKVVDAGYHTRRLLRLTGLDAEENQARQLLNDLDTYRAESLLTDEQQAAHRWLTEVFEPVVRAVPPGLRRKLEPQEIFTQVIQHKWLLSEQAGRDVGMAAAVQSYLKDILAKKPDEQAVLGVEVGSLPTGV